MTDTLTLNLADGSVSFPCSPETAQAIQLELKTLWSSLKTIAASANTPEGNTPSKPDPQPTLEYRQVGDIFLEIFCNPNIWPTPFAAKLLITIRDDRIRVTTEATLNQIMEDLNLFLEQ
ncbi:MAG: hypothetical protein ACO3NK_19075 [Prochlorotrichaceae cyanobacterium]|jgi:hypothetical protein